MKDPMFPASPLHSDASIFARSLISTGQLFLTGSELSEEAAQPAVAYNECLQQRSMWVCVSASSTLSPASSPLPLPLGLPQHNRVPSALTIPPSLHRSHLFTAPSPNLVSRFYVRPSFSPFISPSLPFSSLSLLISIPSSPPSSDWQCYKLIFSPVCFPLSLSRHFPYLASTTPGYSLDRGPTVSQLQHGAV